MGGRVAQVGQRQEVQTSREMTYLAEGYLSPCLPKGAAPHRLGGNRSTPRKKFPPERVMTVFPETGSASQLSTSAANPTGANWLTCMRYPGPSELAGVYALSRADGAIPWLAEMQAWVTVCAGVDLGTPAPNAASRAMFEFFTSWMTCPIMT